MTDFADNEGDGCKRRKPVMIQLNGSKLKSLEAIKQDLRDFTQSLRERCIRQNECCSKVRGLNTLEKMVERYEERLDALDEQMNHCAKSSKHLRAKANKAVKELDDAL